MLAATIRNRSATSAPSKRLFRHASACQELMARSLSTYKDDEENESNAAVLPRNPYFQSLASGSRRRDYRPYSIPESSVVSFDAPSYSRSRSSWKTTVDSRLLSENHSIVFQRELLHNRCVPPSIRVDTSMPSARAMKRLMYTSTVRALETTAASPSFHQNMHRVVQRACFSTTRPGDSKKEASSPESSSAGPSASFSSSSSAPVEEKKSMSERAKEAITSASKAIVDFFFKLPGVMWFYLTHPSEIKARWLELKETVKKEANHYYMGSKLLYADVQTATSMLKRTLRGSTLTRRERKQLLRTVTDLFRLVPFSMFVLIPFMEFALPFALRLFPNMLPSTFQDSLKAEENMKRELKSRIHMAQFFQETLQDLVKEQKKEAAYRLKKNEEADNQDGKTIAAKQEESAASMLDFLEKARSGEMIPPDVIIQYATYFQDDLTLDNLPRMQLVNMCRYMNIPPYGADSFLRFQLRHKIRLLKEDDQRILWEGIDSLTKMELREACQERGMRSTGLSKDGYKRSLQQWLDLSVNKNVPISLLIASRTFFLRDEMTTVTTDDESKSMAGLADAISGLDKGVVNEVVLEVATSEERKSDPEVLKIKLEVLEQQNERIREEQEEREAAAKRKEGHKEKEKEGHKEKEKSDFAADESADVITAEATDKKTEDTTKITTFEDEKKAAAEAKAPAISGVEAPPKEEKAPEEEEHEEEEAELSSQEMDAISQLVNPDPVNREREDLEKIKAAMKSEEEVVVERGTDEAPEAQAGDETEEKVKPTAPEPDTADKGKAYPKQPSEKEAEPTAVDSSKTLAEAVVKAKLEGSSSRDESLEHSISRLKSKVESMVDKIETQLSDVEVKIGDKLHFLDKDMDGIVTREEMALCLQQVLKRDLSFEEALDIAAAMDENNDGVLTVAEFIRWIETNKLVHALEDGLDTDIDSILAKFQNGEKDESTEK